MKQRFSFTRIFFTFMMIGMISFLITGCTTENTTDPIATTETVKVGALLSLTGDWATLGETSQSALKKAETDINALLQGYSVPLRVQVIIADTKLDTTIAKQKIQELFAAGVRIVIGPQSSAEVNAVRSFAQQNNMIVISQGSTAGTLAISGDNVFRFCPSDSLEGKALADLMWAQGIRALVPLCKDDQGNLGLHKATRDAFLAKGGVVTTGVFFNAGVTDFTPYLQIVKDNVNAQTAIFGAAAVGVYLTVFDQVVPVFNQARLVAELAALKWYGSDGVVQNTGLIQDTSAAAFAELTGYPCPTFGLRPELEYRWGPIGMYVFNETGIQPDAFALSTYDALNVVMNTYLTLGTTPTFEDLKAGFITSANSYYGITGATELNAAGDRRDGYFDFWGVRKISNTYQWVVLP